MGFFEKIKQNLHHGGVKIQMQAPASVSMTEGIVPIQVTISATDLPATINKITVELVRNASPDSNLNQPTEVNQSISKVENTDVFSLLPGQSKSINLSLVMNAGKAAANLTDNPALGALAKGLGALQELSELKNDNVYNYSFMATAQVQGISLSPSTSSQVQVLKPGEFGTAINFKS
jgi:hypothetical protein